MLAMRFVEFLPAVLYELWVKRFPISLNIKKKLLDVQSKIAEKKLIEAIQFVQSQGSNAANYSYNIETGSLKSFGKESVVGRDGKHYTPLVNMTEPVSIGSTCLSV